MKKGAADFLLQAVRSRGDPVHGAQADRRRAPRRASRPRRRKGRRDRERVAGMREVEDLIRRAALGHVHRPHPGRERHRQGRGRAGDPQGERPPGRAVRAGAVRGVPRYAHRERAVRLREGGVHGRGVAPAGAGRAGRGGDAVPRRDRRHHAGGPGEAAAAAAGARVRAPRGDADPEVDGALHRGDAPAARGADQEGAVSRGSRSTDSTCCRSGSRRCASGPRTSRRSRVRFCADGGRGERPGGHGDLAAGAGAARATSPGRATCASSRTSSSGWWSCRTAIG